MPSFETSIRTSDPAAVLGGVADLSRWSTFTGWGPLPGVARAELVDATELAAGARVRVTNTDGSVHHEVFERYDRGNGLRIRFELAPPVSWFVAGMVETMEPGGAGIVRRMEVTPRTWLTAPVAAGIAWILGRAIRAHNAVIEATPAP